MFIVRGITDGRRSFDEGTTLDTAQDVGAAVTGITGSQKSGSDAAEYAACMKSGGKFVNYSWGYSIECIEG